MITIFAKGIPANDVTVDFGEQIVCAELHDHFLKTKHFIAGIQLTPEL